MLHVHEHHGHAMGLSLLLAMGIAFSGALLATWMFALAAVLVVPAVLVALATERTARWISPRTRHRPQGPLIIEGEYEVLDSGSGRK